VFEAAVLFSLEDEVISLTPHFYNKGICVKMKFITYIGLGWLKQIE